jgi:hypothetical protein
VTLEIVNDIGAEDGAEQLEVTFVINALMRMSIQNGSLNIVHEARCEVWVRVSIIRTSSMTTFK